MSSSKTAACKTDLPTLVERYFCEYLMKQRNAKSRNDIQLSGHVPAVLAIQRAKLQGACRIPPSPISMRSLFSTRSKSKGAVPSEAGMLVWRGSVLFSSTWHCRSRRPWPQSVTRSPFPSNASTECRFHISRVKK